ncbi:MAG: hypothetical protein Q7W45_11005 [Bacteroidota bacterium]|nr:hypothetical protein [Bacteroidota bacterium]MDP3147148.1 hypothetical protein [Bacteroidota bacterium]
MNSLKTYNSEISLDSRGFLKISFNDTDDEIEFDEIKQQIDACYIMSEGKPIPVLIDVRHGKKNLSPEARNYAGKRNPYKHLKLAEALLINSLAQRIMANFLIKFNKHHHPSKVFTREEAAVKWLLEFVKK